MRRRVFGKLQWLAGNFVAVTPAPLGGSLAGFYKLRVGSYRVIYTIDEKREVLVVHMVGHRSQIYRQRK